MKTFIELHGARANERILIPIENIRLIEELKRGGRHYPVLEAEQDAKTLINSDGMTFAVKESYRQIKNLIEKVWRHV